MEQILVVDDDPGFRRLLETILAGEGYHVDTAGTVDEAIRICGRKQFHLVVSDLRLPDGDGLDVLRWSKEHMPATPVIMITGFGSVASAVEAMKLGAVDYLGKPLSSPDELRMLARKALDQNRAEHERDLLREEQQSRFSCGSIIAEHPSMAKVVELARKVAPTNATVLITGESGTGKEIIAHCIHDNSTRASRAFVPVNCAALSPTLIESELFGHEKGSFTGAVGQHVGRFERAHGGTLFLDEIGELDANLQAKLLRVLQEKMFERVGGTRQISVDVRVIAATNRDLHRSVSDGKFREDLYYRLNLFPIELPPIRERGGDIVKLARFFLQRAGRSMNKPNLRLSPSAEQILMGYVWPGNVRELENMMERMAILCDDLVEADDLPITADGPARPVLFKEIERQAILDALDANAGNRTKTAQQLGISLRTLQYRLKDYGITPA
ncbi:sigma-54 dependent transcriptional regulator [uncultured Paludibaculum sp.]|uniref:sigma-54-dependent transcriptional regulator n=1 Tax=uncultured Paludibaculum sp. TaxID=1765020 RepID=UPI002AAAF43B|nr:sigma-54 dependent transcriptional regulator [uncultured Paludibaculum sp.]